MIPLAPRLIALAILTALAAIVIYYQRSAAIVSAETQIRKQARSTNPKPESDARSRTRTNVGPSSFKHKSHSLPKEKPSCLYCHTKTSHVILASGDAATQAGIRHFPYPYHDKCLNCHRVGPPRWSFFNSTNPRICVVCHTRSSPQLTRNDMNPFPRQTVQMIVGDLSLKFNHDSDSHSKVSLCEDCHRNIVQLDSQKADVPIETCTGAKCHLRKAFQNGKEIPGFEAEMLELTDDDIAGDRNHHTCLSCHSDSIGGMPPPCTHLNLFDTDGTSFPSTTFPKSAKLISKRCK